MSRSPLEYMRHVLEDETLKRAFVRSLEVIGEATKRVPTELRERYPHVK